MVTLDQLQRAVVALKNNLVLPKRVSDEAQAARMTAEDHAGHVWAVGEEYYSLVGIGSTVSVPAV